MIILAVVLATLKPHFRKCEIEAVHEMKAKAIPEMISFLSIMNRHLYNMFISDQFSLPSSTYIHYE